MNKHRRKAIAVAISRLEDEGGLRWKLNKIAELLEELRDEEQEYYDNMPESFQEGEKGESACEAIDHLDSAIDSLRSVEFDDIVSELNAAME